MGDGLFSLKKSKALILLSLIIIISFLTLLFSNMGEMTYFTDEDGHIINYKKYLYTENYILMGILVLLALYFFICLVYGVFKDKNYPKRILIINIILLLLLTPLVAIFTFYSDFIGLHIDQFLGGLFLILGIINILIFAVKNPKSK